MVGLLLGVGSLAVLASSEWFTGWAATRFETASVRDTVPAWMMARPFVSKVPAVYILLSSLLCALGAGLAIALFMAIFRAYTATRWVLLCALLVLAIYAVITPDIIGQSEVPIGGLGGSSVILVTGLAAIGWVLRDNAALYFTSGFSIAAVMQTAMLLQIPEPYARHNAVAVIAVLGILGAVGLILMRRGAQTTPVETVVQNAEATKASVAL